jgi:hypothetical protein
MKHIEKATFASLVTMLTLALITMMLPFATATPDITASPLKVPVTVDGVWSSGEWDDALQYSMSGTGGTSYIRVKHDYNYLYVVVDSPWDTIGSTAYYFENTWLAFDTSNNNGGAPQTDDYLVHPSTSFGSLGWKGTGTVWASNSGMSILAVQAGDDYTPLTTSPNSGTSHRLDEMRIPLTYVGSLDSTVGVYAMIVDDSTNTTSAIVPGGDPIGWPGESDPCPAPSAWDNLILSKAETSSYKVVGGIMTSSTQMGHPDGVSPPQYAVSYWDIPFSPPRNASPYLTPGVGGFDITFGSPDGNGVVPLTVPAASYQGFWHIFWNTETDTYFNLSIQCEHDGYGWLFTQANADVDIIIWNDDTGIYWSGGNQPNQPALPPSIGADGLAGTSDDGFGDGDLDPAGSSILWLNLTLYVDAWNPGPGEWQPLFNSTWPALMTTETTSDFVDESDSYLDGVSTGLVQGNPWEYLRSDEPWVNYKSNVYVDYACTGSVLNIPVSFLGVNLHLDVLFKWTQVLLRTTCEVATPAYPPGTQIGWQWLVGDGDLDNSFLKVDYNDLFALADAYGAYDEGYGKPVADANFDARFDFNYNNRVDFEDLFSLADNYGNRINPP